MDKALWARFGETVVMAPHAIQRLSGSNGLAECFVHMFKRDYVNVHELRDAKSVLAQLAAWIDDYNRLAPDSALGKRSPVDYRTVTSASGELTPPSAQNTGEQGRERETRIGVSTERRRLLGAPAARRLLRG
jgi:integrase-like protein